MESFFQQGLIYAGESVEEGGTPNPRIPFGCLFRHDDDCVTSFKLKVVAVASVPLAFETGKGLHPVR